LSSKTEGLQLMILSISTVLRPLRSASARGMIRLMSTASDTYCTCLNRFLTSRGPCVWWLGGSGTLPCSSAGACKHLACRGFVRTWTLEGRPSESVVARLRVWSLESTVGRGCNQRATPNFDLSGSVQ
jgi:hypothetical protein